MTIAAYALRPALRASVTSRSPVLIRCPHLSTASDTTPSLTRHPPNNSASIWDVIRLSFRDRSYAYLFQNIIGFRRACVCALIVPSSSGWNYSKGALSFQIKGLRFRSCSDFRMAIEFFWKSKYLDRLSTLVQDNFVYTIVWADNNTTVEREMDLSDR